MTRDVSAAPAGISERLREARIIAGLDAKRLDKLAGITPGHVRLIENGIREHPAATTLSRIAAVLGLSLDWLIDGRGKRPSDRAIRAAAEGACAAAQASLE